MTLYKFLITGTPRSGTHYVSDLLTSVGIQTHHEIFYGMAGYGSYREEAQGESSWLAVPFLPRDVPNWKCPVVHIIRDPLRAISSMMRSDFLSDVAIKFNPYTRFVCEVLPRIERMTEDKRYMYFWVEWNKRIESFSNKRLKVEDIHENPDILFDIMKIKPDKTNMINDNKADSYKNVKYLKLEDLREDEFKDEFIKKAKEYGYDFKS